jgi:predicted RNA methylase
MSLKLGAPPARLERSLYAKVEKVLKALGGTWSRKDQAHVFDEDPAAAIDNALINGSIVDRKQALGFFETPLELAERLCAMAEIRPGMRLLEPSAGRGAIARRLACLAHEAEQLQLVEIDDRHFKHLARIRNAVPARIAVWPGDFLRCSTWADVGGAFDRIVANPPFGQGQRDVDHVLHMHACLKPGGLLVSVMADGVMWRDNRKSSGFRQFVERNGGTFEKLPAGSFRAAGTNVQTCVVRVGKARAA